MDSRLPLNHDSDTPPPQYPGGEVALLIPQSTTFHLPSFNDVMALYEYEDSIRLPTYQARSIRRYHPYWRIRPAELDEGTRYFNTIYDESYVELEVPPLVPRAARRVYTPYRAPSPAPELATANDHEAAARLEAHLPPPPLVPPPLPPTPTVAPVHEQAAQDEPLDIEAQHRRRVLRLWYLIPEFVRTVRLALEAASTAAARPPAPVITEGAEHAPAVAPTTAPSSPPATSASDA